MARYLTAGHSIGFPESTGPALTTMPLTVGYNCYSTDSHPRYTNALQGFTATKLYGQGPVKLAKLPTVKFNADSRGVNFPVYTNFSLQSLTPVKFYGYSRAVKFYARLSGLYNSPRW
jgi:hypothetical protein